MREGKRLEGEMNMHELIGVFGILAFIALLLTVATGLMMVKFHVKWVNMKWHTTLAVITVISAIIHVGLVLLFH